MNENKFWSFIAIALAVMAFFYEKQSIGCLLLIGLGTVIFCYLFSYIWNKVVNSNHKWIDALCFAFSKNKLPYTIIDKIINYTICSEKEAKYDLKCKLINNSKDSQFCYKGRYHWDQEEEISVSVEGNFEYKCSEDFKWSTIEITPKSNTIIHNGEKVDCGFSLTNLYMTKLSKHSYLSCKMIEKVKHLKMIATVPSRLKPMEQAVFIIQNPLGDEISREKINYNKSNGTYEKVIDYPRKGRKYIIKWDYDDKN